MEAPPLTSAVDPASAAFERNEASHRKLVAELAPLRLGWNGWTIHTAPLTAGGLTMLQTIRTLEALGHEVQILGVGDELGGIRNALFDFKPHIAFNLLEGFDDVVTFDHNVVAYLELLKVPYTGSGPRGLVLARDKDEDVRTDAVVALGMVGPEAVPVQPVRALGVVLGQFPGVFFRLILGGLRLGCPVVPLPFNFG